MLVKLIKRIKDKQIPNKHNRFIRRTLRTDKPDGITDRNALPFLNIQA